MRFSSISLLPFLLVPALAQTDLNNDGDVPMPLPGDLANGATTSTGKLIESILLGQESGMSDSISRRPSKLACTLNKCCVWFDVSAKLTSLFRGPTGRCNDRARAAIRLGFHDAGTWSKALAAAGSDFGGADGSFILFNEITRPENRGLEEISVLMKKVADQYRVGYADMIQFAATHATVTCPLGPRIRTFIGRKDAKQASPPGLLPDVHAPGNDLIALFEDKNISPHELTALVGAHSASKQFHVDPSRAGSPQDSTPGVWDVRFYNETIQKSIPKKVFKFDSDVELSGNSQTKDEWNQFIDDQSHWNEDYARAYIRLSLLGVNNINKGLTECTDALPPAINDFPGTKGIWGHALGNFADQ